VVQEGEARKKVEILVVKEMELGLISVLLSEVFLVSLFS
jgi:hypothetical protein